MTKHSGNSLCIVTNETTEIRLGWRQQAVNNTTGRGREPTQALKKKWGEK